MTQTSETAAVTHIDKSHAENATDTEIINWNLCH